MTKGNKIKIAGPQNELKIGPAVAHARTHLYVRQRVRDVVEETLPTRRRRPVRGSSKWPGTLSTDVL